MRSDTTVIGGMKSNPSRSGVTVSIETRYRLCPQCHHSVTAETGDHYCVNDGTPMIDACPRCQAAIRVAGAHFCANCGLEYQSHVTQATPAVDRPPTNTDQIQRPNWISTRRGRAASILAILSIAGFVAFGWFSRDAPPNGSFVGEIAGTPLFIALTANSGQVFAYVCDGTRVGEWFKGKIQNNAVTLVSVSGSRFTARIESNSVNGKLNLGADEYAVAMLPAPGSAGLYRSTRRDTSTNIVAGWVVLANQSQRGVISVNGRPFPAPPLDLKTLRVRVNDVGELEVRRADPQVN
jgi:hypothetical protein